LPFPIAARLKTLAPSQIRDMMRLAGEVGAINMAQGRPDFAAADAVKDAAIAAIEADLNQYSVTWGVRELREAVARSLAERFGLAADPEEEVTITCGVTEAMCATVLATVDPGDEVVVIEPAHENYVPAVHFAGGTPRYVALRPPEFALDLDALAAVLGPRTRLVILNTPHNPSGRVFTREELTAIGDLLARHDAILLTDEIYDHLVYDGREHVAPATLPGLAERTITTGGISKIHAVTGWRLGYVVAPPPLTAAVRTVHDFLTICAPTPFQHAAVTALGLPPAHFERIRADYQERRDHMLRVLERGGLAARPPEGAYYVMADFEPWGFEGSAEDFTRHLITEVGVAVVPGPAFYPGHPEVGARLVRFAFAKTADTLDEVGRRLERGFAAARGA